MNANESRNEVSGLCMTCNHANFCVYLASANSTIWNCEEFDDRPPAIESKAEIPVAQPISTIGSEREYQIRKAS